MSARFVEQFWPWKSTVRTDPEHLYRIYSNPTYDKHQWLLLQFIVLVTFWPWNSTVLTDLEHLHGIYSNPTHDKHQWLLLQFIVLLKMDAKGVRNM